MSTQQTSYNLTPNFGVYLVTDPYLGGGPENVPDIVAAAVEGGVRTVQLRDKDATESQITARAEELLQRIGGRIPLFIDDRLEVAKKLGIHLHIGQTDVPYVQARRVLPDHLMIGLSASTKDQIDAVAEQCAEAGVALPDLIGIGPVFPTTTKEDAADACGVEHLGEVARYAAEKGMPSVAIGGINAARVPALLGTGIHGVCVVSDIMAADDPKAAADKLSAAFNATAIDPLTLNGTTLDHVTIDRPTLNSTHTTREPLNMNITANTSASCPRVLSIAGTDPSGGAGIQADLKSIGAAGGYGMSVTTALVAQNTQGVRSIHIPPQSFLTEQLAAVFDDVIVDAVKVGMLGDATTVVTVSDWLDKHPVPVVVVDPVMVATSGDRLLTEEAEEAVRRFVADHATVVTPNLPELAVLLNTEPATSMDEAIEQAQTLARDIDVAVLAKGGHLTEDRADNALVLPDGSVSVIPVPRVKTNNTHGTGCSLSSALATRLSGGDSPAQAVEWSTRWLRESIEFADGLQVGRGNGPIDHFHRMRRLSRAGSAVPWFDQIHAAENSDTGGGGVELDKPTISPAGPYTEELWEAVSSDIWPQILELSFIRALGEGTLHTADFAFYLNQDSLYLREYSRALAGLSTRASSSEEQVFWANGAAGALVEEAEMHRTWLANNSVTLSAHPSPVTKAYTDHLIASVLGQDYVVGVAAVLPCYWLYAEIGAVLHAKNHPEHPYSLWLGTYADEEFARATQTAIQWMEQALEKATDEQRRAARKAFMYASIHEREFFDQAYRAW